MRRVVKSNRLGTVALLALAVGFIIQPQPATAFNMEGTDIIMELVLPDDEGEISASGRNPNEEDVKDHFNLANCLCPGVDANGDKTRSNFGIELTIPDAPTSFANSAPVDIWVGSSCDQLPENINVRDANCELASGFADIDDLIGIEFIDIPVGNLLAPNSGICPLQTGSQSVYAMIDRDTPGILDPSSTENGDYVAPIYNINYDTEPPPAPGNVTASGGESAIQVSWDLPTTRADDIRYFQVLCARADGSVESSDGFGDGTPQFLTTRMVCGQDLDGAHPGLSAGGGGGGGNDVDAGPGDPDAGPATPDAGPSSDIPQSLYDLDPSTLCGEKSGTESNVRVQGLENDVPYHIVLLAIDEARNVTALDVGVYTPKPAEDAWEHYKEAGGQADGGYCFVATATYGNYDHPFVRILRDFRDGTLAHSGFGRDFIRWYYANSPALASFIAEHTGARVVSYILLAPLVAFAAVWEYTGALTKLLFMLGFAILLFRRYVHKLEQSEGEQSEGEQPLANEPMPARKRALIVATSVVLLAALGATAHAQPYWDELNEPLEAGDSVPNWNIEVKAGPFYPGVDDEFSGTGPFEEVFGDKWKIMSALSLDRFFAFPLGQLGVTGSIGYMGRSAAAFELDANGRPIVNGEGELLRSKGDTTSFRLVPTSLGVVYRFTGLDDNFGVPIVPYGKASLAYYLWWFTDPGGNTSESRTPACPNAGSPDADCTGNLGRGGSLGFQGTIGIALRAERLDPSAETSLRTEMGIEHAGFFIEGTLAKVDGFGASDKLSVGDTTWFGGINFEF